MNNHRCNKSQPHTAAGEADHWPEHPPAQKHIPGRCLDQKYLHPSLQNDVSARPHKTRVRRNAHTHTGLGSQQKSRGRQPRGQKTTTTTAGDSARSDHLSARIDRRLLGPHRAAPYRGEKPPRAPIPLRQVADCATTGGGGATDGGASLRVSQDRVALVQRDRPKINRGIKGISLPAICAPSARKPVAPRQFRARCRSPQ